jgi:hypothetical protein
MNKNSIAFGMPGIGLRWTSSAKDGIGTAYHSASCIWFTLSHGIINSAWLCGLDGRKLIEARREDVDMSFGCTPDFTRRSVGYVGFSDGWQDLMDNFKMDWDFEQAVDGNIALIWLACVQEADGSLPQSSSISGEAYWKGIQLDEVAVPILLAWRLQQADALRQFNPWTLVSRAARYLILHGPVTSQERWEENSGYSPSTLATIVASIVCAAEFARSRRDKLAEDFLLDYADWLSAHLEQWLVTSRGELVQGKPRHYVRITPADPTADVILVRSNPLDVVAIVQLSRATYRKMIQNLIWATGYNVVAIPPAAGALYAWGVLLTPALGAVLMSASTVIVAINARLLRLKKDQAAEKREPGFAVKTKPREPEDEKTVTTLTKKAA